MSLAEHTLEVTFRLAQGDFAGGRGPTLTLAGLRADAQVRQAGGGSMETLRLRLYGMRAGDMDRLHTLARTPLDVARNAVTVKAGDDHSGRAVIFEGTLTEATVDYNALPEVALQVQAMTGYYESLQPAPPISVAGSADAAALIGQIAANMGFAFQNQGVTAKLSNAYYADTHLAQLKAITADAGIAYAIENWTVTLWPNGGVRDGVTFTLSPETGLVGYPTFFPLGVRARARFNPRLVRGRKITMQSAVPQACGEWYVVTVQHDVSSQTPQGPWFTTVEMVPESIFVSSF